jgi:hypothetical protein
VSEHFSKFSIFILFNIFAGFSKFLINNLSASLISTGSSRISISSRLKSSLPNKLEISLPWVVITMLWAKSLISFSEF